MRNKVPPLKTRGIGIGSNGSGIGSSGIGSGTGGGFGTSDTNSSCTRPRRRSTRQRTKQRQQYGNNGMDSYGYGGYSSNRKQRRIKNEKTFEQTLKDLTGEGLKLPDTGNM